MKKFTSVIFILLVLLFSSSTVMAQDTKGIYVGILGGYVIPSDASTDITEVGSPSIIQYDASMKNGYLLGAKVGWLTPFTNRIMAVEMEYNYLHSTFDQAKGFMNAPVSFNIDGKVSMNLFMLNLLARYPNGIFHPYIGAGAGYAMIDVDDQALTEGGLPFFIIGGGSQGVFAYQLMAGFDVDVTKNIIVSVAYKYIAPQKVSYDTVIDNSPPGLLTQDVTFKFQAITLGVSYLF
ncbi:MAG: outer membrane beta-barrel protein [Smithellaceae bacterium]|jgi:opacity protein-like surface antigen